MTNSVEFKVALLRAGLEQKQLADMLQISENALSRKVGNINEFRTSEVLKIQRLLGLTDSERDKIFFNFDSEK